MKNKLKTTIGALLLLAFTVIAPMHAQNKVLIVGIDGCRPDALTAAQTPNIDKLIKKGAWTMSAQTATISNSGPCWTSMLTGVWFDKHKVTTNGYKNPNLAEYPHFFHRVKEQKPNLKTYSVVNWQPIHKILQEGDADIYNDLSNDENVTRRVVELLRDDNPDAVFVQLDEVDGAGHSHDYGPTIEKYLAAIEKADGEVGAMIAAIKDRETYRKENWLILVTTDHGGSNYGHGRDIPEHTTIFYIAQGKRVKKGKIKHPVNVTDIAVTAMQHLGIDMNNEWNLDGKVSGMKK
ncbi:Type I phosphodiesterase / nucleotide pyrophosphatase [Saccharicrinis carchari]|uniref:Type I phosphodiesterase / nucleotide pyrophosphatase n=1 Tax=Saccharicrinis carchari TaxID=1168039 RepID=A0A521BZ30_SACCC|nr:alkaline phosphatase family protein [Saccharicrinis carchari]SMO52439.1 Type I phosphodiesterase / nucleotide pyrophosphatase [Saccharicrinis carchari]